VSEDNAAIEDAIAALASQMASHGYSLNRTKLVKLLYFIDLEAWQEIGQRVTGVNWIWDNYGPFSVAILEACDRMSETGELDVRMEKTGPASRAFDIRSDKVMYFKRPSEEVMRLIRNVVREYGQKSATRLKELSYQTPPMKRVIEEGQRGDELQFPPRSVSPADVKAAVARYAGLVRRQEQSGDVATALRTDLEDLREGRESATTKLLPNG
jgi:uncharacterized phage-associated protein